MKFEKVSQQHSGPTPLNDEQIVLANRWADREAKRKASVETLTLSPAERERGLALFENLSNSLGGSGSDPWRVRKSSLARGKDARYAPAVREAANEHLEELLDRYADSPPLEISPELKAIMNPWKNEGECNG